MTQKRTSKSKPAKSKTRVSLSDRAVQDFLSPQKSSVDSSTTEANTESIQQKSTEKKSQAGKAKSKLLEEIIPEQEATKRLTVDLPESLYDQLTEVAKSSKVTKSHIVRLLIAKALNADI